MLSSSDVKLDRMNVCSIMVILAPTCIYSNLNLKLLSDQGFAVGCMKRQFPSIARDDTKHFDGLLNGNYFLGCNGHVSAAAINCHNKGAWMTIFVHHTALQPEEKAHAESVSSEH